MKPDALSSDTTGMVWSVLVLGSSNKDDSRTDGHYRTGCTNVTRLSRDTGEVPASGRAPSRAFMSRRPADNLATLDTFEFILMERKGGGYRKPDLSARILNLLSETSFKRLLQQIWTDIPGVSTRDHPAPFPVTLGGTPDPDVQFRRGYGSRSVQRNSNHSGRGRGLWQKQHRNRGRPRVLRRWPRPSAPRNQQSPEHGPSVTTLRRVLRHLDRAGLNQEPQRGPARLLATATEGEYESHPSRRRSRSETSPRLPTTRTRIISCPPSTV